MKLIDIKDTLPVGFIPIQETVDTRKRRPYLLSLIYSYFSLNTAAASLKPYFDINWYALL